MIGTAILVLFNHKWALHFVLLATIGATLGIARDFWIQNLGFSTRTIWLVLRLLFFDRSLLVCVSVVQKLAKHP
jgi:hypothetical protein